ncbi:MAG: hypothetical protein HYX53_12905 [Chloroflexi bacterium]|nr:hypothetical protein [Chloroflexota bacterium]
MHTRRGFVVVAAIAAMFVSVACSGSSPGRATPATDSVTVDAVTLKQLNDGQHAFQLSLLAGNRLDRAGYDRLAGAYQQCIAEAGASFGEGSMQSAFGTYNFEIFMPVGTEAAAAACASEYWEPLGSLWSMSHMPTKEQIQAGNNALGDCLRRAGAAFAPERPTVDDFRRFNGTGRPSDTFLACVRTVSQQLKLPNFSGG